MNEQNIWMVRAGRGAEHIDDFLDNNLVAIGFGTVDVSPQMDKALIEAGIAEEDHTASPNKIAMSAAQLKRYYDEVKVGDAVATYDPNQRLYFIGEIASDVELREHPLSRARRVKWAKKVSRDSLQTSTRNVLGAIMTLFLVRDDAARDMWHHAIDTNANVEELQREPAVSSRENEDRVLTEEVITKSEEFIEDRIARLDWEEMQELVAEILIAMGYQARVSRKGPDRGHDVFASPDGLGLQEPRIFVEVKHRPGTQIGSNEIRSFLGGRQPGDRCLYVSTGGFTKDARYEADRSSVPITLITLPQLRELLVEHYEKLRPTGTALVPLERIYWPAQ